MKEPLRASPWLHMMEIFMKCDSRDAQTRVDEFHWYRCSSPLVALYCIDAPDWRTQRLILWLCLIAKHWILENCHVQVFMYTQEPPKLYSIERARTTAATSSY